MSMVSKPEKKRPERDSVVGIKSSRTGSVIVHTGPRNESSIGVSQQVGSLLVTEADPIRPVSSRGLKADKTGLLEWVANKSHGEIGLVKASSKK
jgi:hypothetical protein